LVIPNNIIAVAEDSRFSEEALRPTSENVAWVFFYNLKKLESLLIISV